MSLLNEAWLANLRLRVGEFTLGGCIANLLRNPVLIPTSQGVYLIVRNDSLSIEPPAFVEPGTGGAFKGKNPNVSKDTLTRKWVLGANVLYIGKAVNLASRLNAYFRFGQGFPAAHWGGRYIWQLPSPGNLSVYWVEIENSSPREIEHELLIEFEKTFGKLPFANLRR